jgi:hypothetical protein
LPQTSLQTCGSSGGGGLWRWKSDLHETAPQVLTLLFLIASISLRHNGLRENNSDEWWCFWCTEKRCMTQTACRLQQRNGHSPGRLLCHPGSRPLSHRGRL